MKQKIVIALLSACLLAGCGNVTEETNIQEISSQEEMSVQESEPEEVIDWEAYFKSITKMKSYKGLSDTNPIMTQRFGADPYAMVYGDRVYFYMTADAFEYDAKGEIIENSYSKIQSLNVVSTDDMVNFTDHGSIQVAGKGGAAKWAGNSWAPAAAWKNIDGKDKFFLYFANSGGGIGVLTADSPIGPFTDPLGHEIVSRNTPNCANVLWLFDPAVLVDDDGRAYLYFGGGVPADRISDPGTGRVVELGEDMISLACDPVPLDVPYLFEDSGIHKANNKYYYTYCSNWQVDQAGTDKYGFVNAEIVSLESDNPMGPFKFKEVILENPGKYCGLYGNNHHCVFKFKDKWYMTYHSRVLEKAMKIEHGYRITMIDEFTMDENGTIGKIKQTMTGREQLKYVDPFKETSAVNVALMSAGLDTVSISDSEKNTMVLTSVEDGCFTEVQGVDFTKNSPKSVSVTFRRTAETDKACAVEVRIDKMYTDILGHIDLSKAGEADADGFMTAQATLDMEVTDVHDLFFVFAGEGYEVKSWQFK